MNTEYVFDTASDLGHQQVRYLAELYDHATEACLERAGAGRGLRRLEIGAGTGSVAAMLARYGGAGSRVVAAEIEPEQVSDAPGVTVVRHDINDGVPAGGPYELIHGRLVLMHLSRRVEVLAMLVDGLAQDGWLVLGDLGERLPRALAAPSDEDAALFDRIITIGMTVLAPRVGMSVQWGEQLADHLRGAGLLDVEETRVSRTCRGGTPGCLVLRSYILQLAEPLRGVGVGDEEIARFVELMTDPQMCVTFYELVYASGRKASGTGEQR
ncbi:class I SAM-dependent methyltransferase [Solicola gregarius]|uniref:Class I SAM-dependent methyltransferase n=1 Tax=Solicola gregarius TaxID=2908642 RepID=A0AA46YKP1_9ACTN|nr:class I SAM-dependent methyltransferase [Solicola gregarius]UYM04691.1 class I SAM-dependent methyltransferase [Solicola gregarius]